MPHHTSALTLTASLATRPIGALIFGVMADRYDRRFPLMLDVIFYSVIEVLSGLAPSYTLFLILRLLYGIGKGGEWGVGAALTMESVPPKAGTPCWSREARSQRAARPNAFSLAEHGNRSSIPSMLEKAGISIPN
jgi:MFS family permease